MKRALLAASLFVSACTASNDQPDFGIEPADLKSGYEFITAESQVLQTDDFSNPGLLWVEKGEQVFGSSGCLDCHKEDDFSGNAAGFPKIHEPTNTLINLQGQINYCQTERLNKEVLPYESEDMLGLVSFFKSQGQGQPMNYEPTQELEPYFAAGKDYFFQRRGQFNLSCAQCHDENWGAKMRGDTVSQGHINGFPTFRNEWQTLGSAHRRFQACNEGVRAKVSDLGSMTYLELEVYLMARGSGLNNETPSIRR